MGVIVVILIAVVVFGGLYFLAAALVVGSLHVLADSLRDDQEQKRQP